MPKGYRKPLVPDGRPLSLDEIRALHLKAAIYIRMSTDLQTESPEIQERIIREYATRYSISIVKVYADLGASGITAEGREQFSTLLQDVESNRNEFNIILYLDETRWGRFVDTREADYYRMCLEKKGVFCQSCEQEFTFNKSDIYTRIKTMLDDVSSSNYSRQLSQKVFIGQCNLINKGFRQGGPAGYGLRRMLLDEVGQHKYILAKGQRKSLQTERVILVPGPDEELVQVSQIYDKFINGMRELEIAAELNDQGLTTDFGRPWSIGTVRGVLTNEKYIGNNIYNRTSGKLKAKAKPNPSTEWIRKDNSFTPVIDLDRFSQVQAIIQERHKKFSNSELLERLKILYQNKGWLSAIIIDESVSTPPSSLYASRFGGLLRAYKLVGYEPGHDYRYIEINRTLRQRHKDVFSDTIANIERLSGRQVSVDPASELLEINHCLLASIVICRCFKLPSGVYRWKIRFDTALCPDITIAVRMDSINECIHDYYLLPAICFNQESICLYEENPNILDSFRFDSLDLIWQLGVNVSIDGVKSYV